MKYLKLLLDTAPEQRVQACLEDPSLLDAALEEASALLDDARIDAACSAMNGLLANGAFATGLGLTREADEIPGIVLLSAVRYADAMLAALASTKGGGA